ncbi:cellulose-binding protein [Streptomyces sp. NPDC002205]|uniref:cellulose-binding protein n=1 Tax=Streptomyces sp. NPDC002205 TaxID=3154411 RepID=UPI0033307D91
MSAAPVSAHGFVVVRGRGYRPEQVDGTVTALSAAREEAWELLARLTALAEELEAESAGLAEVVATLAPQTYVSLGERAQEMLALAEAEAEAVRGAALEEARALRDTADAAARAFRGTARADSDAMRAAAGAHVDETVSSAQRRADDMLAAALKDAGEVHDEVQAAVAETRRRTAAVLANQEQEHTERWKAAERELAEAEAAQAAHHDALTEQAENRLAEARRALAETEEAARHGQEDAEAQSTELIAAARVREERVVRETERILREHEEGREEVLAHMAHVRNSLAALTGRGATAEG